MERTRILLDYSLEPSSTPVGGRIGVTHQTVQRCLRRAVRLGAMAALDYSPRHGRSPHIIGEAKAWLVYLACQKAKDFGYPHELWTTRLLARHARTHATGAGHACLTEIVQGTVCKILIAQEIKPHKVRYYLERRGEAFETKMAEVLCVHREVAVMKDSKRTPVDVAVVSDDEKPGMLGRGGAGPPCRRSLWTSTSAYRRAAFLSLPGLVAPVSVVPSGVPLPVPALGVIPAE